MLSFNKWIGAVAFGQSLLCSTLGLLAGPDDPAKSLSVQHFSSPQTEGFIGVTDDAPIDNPADNIFHVQIDEPLCGEENVWLVYELDGVQDHTAVSRSVNDQVAVGGYLVRERHGWAVQRERLNAEWLKAGDNVIRFTLPEHAAHSYRIRNLRIEVDRSTVKQSTPQIVFNQSSDHYFFDKAYIKGFVSGAGYENVRIIVDGKEARMFNGEFETIVDFARAENTCSVEVEARHADGTTTCHSVVFSEPLTADYQYNIDQFTYRTEKYFDASKEGTVSLHGARLDHAVNALKENATLSITSLRAVDIPALDGGMVNVTKNHVGFRFLPHGTVFGKEVNVTLPFDAAAIPDGYTEKDIRTYYFDEQSHHWVAMTLDTVLIEKGEVVSKTLHFTDMINAIIKVPESPEVSAYNSTSMKGIKAANPTAGINLINPPQANNTGNASIGYPLNIPAGRAGMQPQLTISYNSGGGNGWMGLGWNLSLPMISIDTRWGVPRYDSLWETETYTMNGEQLTPVAHRGELRPRTNGGNEGVRFYPRVEGAFNKIVRHGDTPANYWWEVTDKNGTRYFYGGSPTGFEEDAVLRTREGSSTAYKGKVAQWFLREVRDLNGNTVRYHYAKIADAGVEGGTVKGHQMYIEKITYTGVNGGDGPYVVKFTRESGRPDKIIMANLGFKQVTGDRLKRIDIGILNGGQEPTPIRSYELNYITGEFYKSLLESIVEYDSKGEEFNRHTFNYYNEVRVGDELQPLAGRQEWGAYDDGVDANFKSDEAGFKDQATALGGTKSKDKSAGVTVSVGVGADIFTKRLSAGVSGGYSVSESEGLVTLMDMNGDGLQDKVVVKDGQFFYRANLLGEAGATAFADRPSPITGISSFYKDKSKTINYGGEASFGLFVGFSRSKTTSKTSTYFADVNGDQLPDIVSKGIVYFNHLDPETGAIEYRPTSRGTPNVITSSKAIENDLFDKEALERDRQEAIDQNPLVDIVRMWRAPFDGTISVTAPIEFLQSDDKERPDAPADGVRVAIQLQNVELWSDTIGAVEYGTHEPPVMNNLQVRQGDQLFFRLGSRDHGRYDSIRWQPVIEYTDKDADLRDANGKLVYRFSAAEDFLLASAQTVSPPFDGELKLTGAFHKPKTTDDVALFVIREREGSDADTVWRRKFAWHEVIVKLPDTVISVKQADVYRLQLVSQTNIDWTAVQWKPRLLYTSVADPSVKLPDSIDFLPAVDYSLYVNTVRFADPVRVKLDSAGQRDTLQISPRLLFTIDPYEPFYEKELTFSVKKTDTLLAKRTIKIRNGEIVSDSALSVPVVHDDTLFIEVHADDYSFVLKLSGYKASYSIAGRDTTVQAGFYTVAKKTLDEDDAIFGNLYRGWGHFGWNANRHWVDEPIDPTLLKISQKAKDQGEMNTDGMTGDDLEKMDRYNPKADRFLLLVPDVRTGQWTSGDQFAYLAADVMSSSRLGDDDLSILTIAKGDTGEELIPGIEKVSKSNGKGSTLGVSLGLGASKSESDAYSYTLTDYMDLNGDRYPDIISEKKIQYTGAHGGLSDKITSGVGISQETHATTDGYALSGSMPMAMPKFRKSNKNGSTTQTDAGDAASTSGGASLSAGTTTGTNDASYTWVDMNGDGLPDRVDTFGQVALNLGYTFAAPETWAFEEIQSGGSETITGGVGLGFNFAQNSISGGISLARSDNFSNAALMDANGDGLPDRVKKGEPLQVWINTGSGFAQDPVSWNGASAISENATASESANASFTVGFTALTVKWNVSPSGSVGKAMSRETSKFTDMNGDGYPDFVKSTDENDLDVYPSTIGRTNLLKSVQRPLGASFAMTYSYIGNSYEMPNGVWALDSVKVADGFAGDGVDNMATAFAYEDGRYDRREREFYGFGKVITNSIDTEDNANTVYTSVTQTFANDNYYAKGLLLSELMTDGEGNKYVAKESKYKLKNGWTGVDLTEDEVDSDTARIFPALDKTVQMFYEGQSDPGKQTSTAYKYDVNGNITDYIDHGDDTPDDDLHATITYHNYPDKYLIGAPEHIIVKDAAKTLRERKSVIDPSTGNVTQIKQFISEDEIAVYDMQYDQYGNLETIIRPENHKGERLSIVYKYDNVVNTYPTNVSNSYGYSSEADYDFKFGQVLMSKDLNGNEITYELDAKGRVQFITGPYEKGTGNKTIEFEYHPEAEIPWALTKHYDPADPQNKLETEIFVDGLGRVLQTKKDVAIYQGEGKADTEMMVVSGRVEFDAFGRTVSALYPVTEPKDETPGEFNDEKDQEAGPTVTEYDVLNRTLKVTLPDKSVTATAYGFGSDREGNNQFSTKTTDANGKQTEQFTDVRGRVTAVKNYTSKQDVWTSFKYNAINEQVEATNDLGHTTISLYDNLGRRTTRIHPDAGQTNYFYDLAGNLIELQTANLIEEGLSIDYVYDHERLVEIHYPQNPENNVKYTYGEPGASDNRAGRIVIQEDGSGAQEFFYGPLGEVVKNIRTVVIPQHDEQTYTTQWQYDTWNRLTSMTYPDGEKVTYNYNSGGLLRSMTGKKKGTTFNYVNQLGYDKFEQRVYLEYGNGTKTHYEYEPDRRRLHNMTAQTKAKRLFMDNVYTYDKVNNIKMLENKAPIPSSNLMGGSSTYSYDYDDLYRLTTAEGSYKGSNEEHSYTLSMDYNSVGGITQKTQVHKKGEQEQKKTTYDLAYAYGETQPNAPIHIGDQTYTYDANGNQTGWTSDISGQQRKIMWDEENRIRSIYDNGSQHHYIYDAAGERVLKGKSTGQRIFVNGEWKAGSGQMGNYTVYVNPYLVLKSGGYTKHYYIEGQRIVSKLGGGWDNKNSVKAAGNKVDYVGKTQKVFDGIVKNLKFLGADGQILTAGKSGKIPPGQVSQTGNVTEAFRYFYHPDHLGSTSYVTDASGEVYQHLEYFAFGETFVEEHSNTDRTPYLFNSKELDGETGFYYYGARYYDPRTSIFSKIDPMADKYPMISAYAYAFNNPLRYIDPTGMEGEDTTDPPNEYTIPDSPDKIDTKIWEEYKPDKHTGHSKYWRNRENGAFLAYDEGVKGEKGHYHLYSDSKFKTRIDIEGNLSGSAQGMGKGAARFHLKSGAKINLSALSKTMSKVSAALVIVDLLAVLTQKPDNPWASKSGIDPNDTQNRAYGLFDKNDPLNPYIYEFSQSGDNAIEVRFYNSYYWDHDYGHWRGRDMYDKAIYTPNQKGTYMRTY